MAWYNINSQDSVTAETLEKIKLEQVEQEKQMQLLAKKHSDWKNLVNSFGGNQALSEDLVQEMYIKIKKKLEKNI